MNTTRVLAATEPVVAAIQRASRMGRDLVPAERQAKSLPGTARAQSNLVLCKVTGAPNATVYPVTFLASNGGDTGKTGYAIPNCLHISQILPVGTVFVGMKVTVESLLVS